MNKPLGMKRITPTTRKSYPPKSRVGVPAPRPGHRRTKASRLARRLEKRTQKHKFEIMDKSLVMNRIESTRRKSYPSKNHATGHPPATRARRPLKRPTKSSRPTRITRSLLAKAFRLLHRSRHNGPNSGAGGQTKKRNPASSSRTS